MSTPTATRQWVLKEKPGANQVNASNFTLKENVPIFDSPKEGKILVKVLYISSDAAQRMWMDSGAFNARSYLPPVMSIGAKVFSGGVGEVIESYTPEFSKGDLVFAHFGWTEYVLHDPKLGYPAQKIPAGLSGPDYMMLDLVGQAAYFGLLTRGRAHSGMDTIVVSSAAGGVGILVIQIAKRVLGVKNVVGITGSDEKGAKLKEKGWVDIALNYNSPTFEKEFEDATPNYIDLYYDNVGGKVLDMAIQRIATNGTVVAVGAISTYERGQTVAVTAESWVQVLHQQANILGFLVTHYYDQLPKLFEDMLKWKSEGKMDLVYSLYDLPFEKQPEALRIMFDGKNFGKTITKIAW